MVTIFGQVGDDTPIWISNTKGDSSKPLLVENPDYSGNSADASQAYSDTIPSGYVFADDENSVAVYDP